jgi:aryl-alcohol dehydrogenase-like predicted oxidoreductase
MSYGDASRRAWVLDERAAEPIVRRAVERGFTFFDTADMYAGGASEVVTGRLLRKLISREEAVVATKVFYPTTQSDPEQDSLYGRPGGAEVVDRVAEIGRERGVSGARVALAWLFHKSGVAAPIVGATRTAHIDDAVAAAELELGRDEIAQLEEPYSPHGDRG